jgi:hypothetical protein
MTPTPTDSPRAALDHLQARRRAVLNVLKGWPPETLGCDAWQARMNELANVNRELGRVFEELEDETR